MMNKPFRRFVSLLHLRGLSLYEISCRFIFFAIAFRKDSCIIPIIISLSEEKESAIFSAKVTTAYSRKIVAQFWSPVRQRTAARRILPIFHRAMAAETEIKACDFLKVE